MSVGSCTRRVAGVLARRPASASSRTAGTGSRSPKRLRSIYFTDPNGIALEASWWVTDATGRPSDYSDRNLFGDRDPVPAVRELAEAGRLASTPATRLVQDPTDIPDPA